MFGNRMKESLLLFLAQRLWRLATLPVRLFFGLIRLALGLAGRLLAIGLGVAIMIGGVIISFTVVGAVVGIPLFLFGFLLVLRGLF